MTEGRDDQVAVVLREHYRLADLARADGLGVNNRTWQAGGHWLTCRPAARAGQLARETELFARINAITDSPAAPCAVRAPQVIADRSGNRLVRRFGQNWRLTSDLGGQHPAPEDLAGYRPLAAGLANLHASLASLDAEPVWPSSILDWALRLAEVGVSALDLGLPLTTGDRAALARTLDMVGEYAPAFDEMPRQLIHGDVSHPNLRVDAGTGALVGVLDLEFARLDPVVLDLGTLALTALTRSGARRPEEMIEDMTTVYEDHAGLPVDRDAVYAAMLVLKLWSYWHHGHRALRDGTSPELALSQASKCKAVREVWDRARTRTRR